MGGEPQLWPVSVAVTVAGRLFDDALVCALRRRCVDAWSTQGDQPRPRAEVHLVDERLALQARPANVGARFVLLVARCDRAATRRARSIGASACLDGTASLDDLALRLARVAAGADLLTLPGSHEVTGSLTSREIEVLRLMAAGHDNASIAVELDISPHTARTHVQRILTKFEVRSRFSAVSVARGRGLLRSGT
jgi:DNA-binding NarL/FixJ family response regulator